MRPTISPCWSVSVLSLFLVMFNIPPDFFVLSLFFLVFFALCLFLSSVPFLLLLLLFMFLLLALFCRSPRPSSFLVCCFGISCSFFLLCHSVPSLHAVCCRSCSSSLLLLLLYVSLCTFADLQHGCVRHFAGDSFVLRPAALLPAVLWYDTRKSDKETDRQTHTEDVCPQICLTLCSLSALPRPVLRVVLFSCPMLCFHHHHLLLLLLLLLLLVVVVVVVVLVVVVVHSEIAVCYVLVLSVLALLFVPKYFQKEDPINTTVTKLGPEGQGTTLQVIHWSAFVSSSFSRFVSLVKWSCQWMNEWISGWFSSILSFALVCLPIFLPLSLSLFAAVVASLFVWPGRNAKACWLEIERLCARQFEWRADEQFWRTVWVR